MKVSQTLSLFKLKWHTLRVNYHHSLLNDCLDGEIEKKLRRKLVYHETKVDYLLDEKLPN